MPGTRTEPTLLWVCFDCINAHANGEDPLEPTEHEPLSEIPEDADVTMGMLRKEHARGCPNRKKSAGVEEECECETIPFSSRTCDGCGCPLAGERHALTMWTEPELVRT